MLWEFCSSWRMKLKDGVMSQVWLHLAFRLFWFLWPHCYCFVFVHSPFKFMRWLGKVWADRNMQIIDLLVHHVTHTHDGFVALTKRLTIHCYGASWSVHSEICIMKLFFKDSVLEENVRSLKRCTVILQLMLRFLICLHLYLPHHNVTRRRLISFSFVLT